MTQRPHDKKTDHKVLSQKHGRGHLKCTIDGRAAVTWISIKRGGEKWTGFMCYRTEACGKALGSTVKNLQVP